MSWTLKPFYRRLGRVLAGAAMISGVFALIFGGRFSYGGLPEASAAVVFGLWFLACLVLAVRAIRRDDIVHHRRWMIRAFAIGIGTTRIWLQILPLAGLDFASRFGPAFWISFSLHAVAAELWLRAVRIGLADQRKTLGTGPGGTLDRPVSSTVSAPSASSSGGNMRLRTAAATVFATAILLGGAATTASAAEIELDAGVACAFPLGLDGGALPPVRRTFTDPNGNPIVVLAGKSGAVTYTNLDTGESLTFPSRGTALRVTTQSDGTQLLEFSGNVGLLLFPGDRPVEGPSTTQINGRLVFEQAGTVTTVLKQEGNQIDVCAALS